MGRLLLIGLALQCALTVILAKSLVENEDTNLRLTNYNNVEDHVHRVKRQYTSNTNFDTNKRFESNWPNSNFGDTSNTRSWNSDSRSSYSSSDSDVNAVFWIITAITIAIIISIIICVVACLCIPTCFIASKIKSRRTARGVVYGPPGGATYGAAQARPYPTQPYQTVALPPTSYPTQQQNLVTERFVQNSYYPPPVTDPQPATNPYYSPPTTDPQPATNPYYPS